MRLGLAQRRTKLARAPSPKPKRNQGPGAVGPKPKAEKEALTQSQALKSVAAEKTSFYTTSGAIYPGQTTLKEPETVFLSFGLADSL